MGDEEAGGSKKESPGRPLGGDYQENDNPRGRILQSTMNRKSPFSKSEEEDQAFRAGHAPVNIIA